MNLLAGQWSIEEDLRQRARERRLVQAKVRTRRNQARVREIFAAATKAVIPVHLTKGLPPCP